MRKVALLVLLSSFSAFAQSPTRYFDGKSWWEHVKVLADDKLEGRDTGSEGLRKAQAYVVDQLKADGLQPKGTNGFYQPVKFVSRQLIEKDSSLALVHDGKTQPLTLGDEAIFSTRAIVSSQDFSAPLAFVGYGLDIPEKNYNDLKDQDLKGKIAVYITGAPADVPSAVASHHQTAGERWKALRAAGIIGVISIPNPASMDLPWSRITLNRNHPSMDLAGAEFHETEGEKIGLYFNPDKAEELFAGSGHTFAEIAALGKDRKPMPHFPLAISIHAKAHIESSNVESANLIAAYPGSDPKLKNEYVVLSAHIDHVGIGEPINGDKIYNGAMDNASGSALLLDVARSLAQNHVKTKRSVLFVFVTAEEKGLLGSKYFAVRPTVPASAMVSDVNADMFLPIVPLKLLTVYGLAESDLGDRASAVAKSFGVDIQPDPAPLRNIFIRSDQYNFVRRGVPSVMIDVGVVKGSPEDNIRDEWLHNRYHAPSDDVNQPIDFATAALYEDIIRALVVSVADDPARPQWKADSFFRRYATNEK